MTNENLKICIQIFHTATSNKTVCPCVTVLCPLTPPLHSSSQVQARSSCGSSCWSCCPTATTRASSPGRAPMASSRWPTRTRWPSAGASARASPTWTMTSWAVLCVTTTTRTSWLRCTASATPTNLTSTASHRHTRITLQKGGLLSTRLRCRTSSPTTITSPKWTSWVAIRHPCPSPLATFLALRQRTGTHPTAPSILGHPWPGIQPPTPTWARTTEDDTFHAWTWMCWKTHAHFIQDATELNPVWNEGDMTLRSVSLMAL